MTKLYARIPKSLSEKGTLYRIFNGTNNEIQIEQKSGDEKLKFGLKNNESRSKYLEGSKKSFEWIINDKGEKDEYEKEKISLKLKEFKPEELGAIWLPKNKYRPGDTIKGYIFLRKKASKGSNILELLPPDEKKPFVLDLVDEEKNTIKSVPISELSQPILYFEIDIAKYNPTGNYSLYLKKSKEIIHDLSLTIAHYDKPDIEVFIDLPKWKLVGEDVTCAIQSKYYHGEPVISGTVKLSSEGFEKDIEKKFSNGFIGITLPELLPGNHSIKAIVEDENDRNAISEAQINIVEEPLQIQLTTNPATRPFIEHQGIDFLVKIVNPINLPISDKKVQCRLLNEKQEDILGQQEYYTDKQGFVSLSQIKLKQGNYSFVVLVQTDTGPYVSLTDHLFVRKPNEEDLWIQIIDIPYISNPGEVIKGHVVLKGPGITNINTREVFLDVITDRILDTKKYELKNIKSDEIILPISVDIPNNYYGDLELEVYLNPIDSESFEQKIKTAPINWFGEYFSFPKTSTKKKIEILSKPKTISFDVETNKEVTTGTNFDIRVRFNGDFSEKDIWVGVALTDERVLKEYQPISPISTFNVSTSTVEVVTIGSKHVALLPPLPESSPFVLRNQAREFRRMRVGGVGFDTARKSVIFDAVFDLNEFESALKSLESIDVSKLQIPESKLTTSAPQQVIRTEFPEDIVKKPEKIVGEYKIDITSPDSITRYKIFVLACTETHFGVEERSIIVKNPIFTTTLNPPEMTLGDRISLPTVIENLSDNELTDITITANSNQNLKVQSALVQKLNELKPKEKINIYWDVEASKVGDVDFSTLLESFIFSEYSKLQKPIYISPPGVPHPQLYRSKLEANKPWIQDIEITGEEAFSLGIVNFLPGLELASIEGVESLAKYPYGCCEQTSATTIPNAIAYQYLESNNKLTDDLKNTLINNMKAGLDRYSSKFLNEENGGFGLWDGANPSVFHTSLAISVIGKISPYIEVPEQIFTGARNFLSSNQNKEGFYDPSKGVHHIFPATLSKLAMTAYVCHSQALGGIVDQPALEWLLKQQETDEFKEDSTVISLTLDSLALLKEKLPKEFVENISNVTKLLLFNIEEDEKGSYWSKGSSLSSEIETTSYALAALAHTENYSAEILKIFETGANYLLNTRSSSGWFTTRDTLWATLALGEIASKMEQNAVNGTLIVKLNGETITSELINNENKFYKIYNVRNIYLDKFQKGSNSVEITIEGEGSGHIVLEIHKWYEKRAKKALPIKIDQTITQKENISISYVLDTESSFEAVMLEQPIPTGCEVEEKTIEELRNISGVNHVEINNNLVSLFLTELKKFKISLSFTPKIEGKIQINGLRIMPMYQPEVTTTFENKWIEIPKQD